MQSSCLAADVLQLPPLLLLLIRAASLFSLFVVVVEHSNIRFLLSRVTNSFGSFGDNKKFRNKSFSTYRPSSWPSLYSELGSVFLTFTFRG